MSGKRVGVALIGAGVISKQYLDNLTRFPDVEVLAITDLFPEAAAARAEEYGIAQHGTPDLALNHPDVEIIVNLTIPAAHVEVATQAIRAGKHVWSEKPFSLDRESGTALLAEAKEKGLRLGCAPDTFLGAGLQTARRLIEAGEIGTPVSARTVFQTSGPEAWHPNPAFLYAKGAGPLFDMGPYYLTGLVQIFGSISRVSAVGSRSEDVRVIGSGPKAGEAFPVEVDTYVSANIEFASGASANSTFSFQSPQVTTGFFEVAGTEASLLIPDPNNFNGDLKIWRNGDKDWTTVPTSGPDEGRGLGVLDMARAIRNGGEHRATGDLAYHVLDAMTSIDEAASTGQHVTLHSQAPTSAPLPEDWAPLGTNPQGQGGPEASLTPGGGHE